MIPIIAQIQAAVCAAFGVTREELVGPDKSQLKAKARQTGMTLARELSPASLVEIAAAFGRTAHSAVNHAEIAITALRLKSESFDAAYHRIAASLGDFALIIRIQAAVCTAYGVTQDELLGSTRTRATVRARQTGMALARELSPASSSSIASTFGCAAHGTVLHAVKTIAALRSSEPSFEGSYQRLLCQISPAANTEPIGEAHKAKALPRCPDCDETNAYGCCFVACKFPHNAI